MPSQKDVVLMADYNAAMNVKLYAAAATLPAQVLTANRCAFFGSIMGTLNHLVAGDTIWLRRFLAHPSAFIALTEMADIAAPEGLAHVFSDDLEALRQHRVRLDTIIQAFAAEVSDEDLSKPLTYRNVRGEFQKSFGIVLLHLFNHQTHHRGQVSTLLSQLDVDIGVTDLVAWVPDYAAT